MRHATTDNMHNTMLSCIAEWHSCTDSNLFKCTTQHPKLRTPSFESPTRYLSRISMRYANVGSEIGRNMNPCFPYQPFNLSQSSTVEILPQIIEYPLRLQSSQQHMHMDDEHADQKSQWEIIDVDEKRADGAVAICRAAPVV
jgi:hypothetical protein